MEKNILTSVWSAQNSAAGKNIQQEGPINFVLITFFCLYTSLEIRNLGIHLRLVVGLPGTNPGVYGFFSGRLWLHCLAGYLQQIFFCYLPSTVIIQSPSIYFRANLNAGQASAKD